VRHGRKTRHPSRDELTQAMSVALALGSVTSVTETEFAVYAHGAEAWICPNCLSVNELGQNQLPLAPTNCYRCGTVLQ